MYKWLKRKLHTKHNLRSRRVKNTVAEILWGQIFDFATRDSQWFISTKLNPGRWALGFPALYVLFRTLDEVKPRCILEFGLGESTRLTAQYCAHFTDTELTVIEQSEEWKDIFCRNHRHLKDNIKTVPIRTSGKKHKLRHDYEGLIPVINGRKYDLVIIDGPWGSYRDSRREILDIVEAGLLADDFVIILDDAERRGERDTLRRLCTLLKSKDIIHAVGRYDGKKDTRIICSAKYKFLTSL